MSQTRAEWFRRSAAEFVVIVVGVLVALTVDQWVTVQAERGDEGEYVAALIRDVESDLVELDSVDSWSTRRELRLVTALSFVRGDTAPPPDTILAAFEMGVWQWPLSLATYTIDDLRATGNLDLIRDASVRRMIAEYYKEMELWRVVVDTSRDRVWKWLGERVQPHLLTATDRVHGARLGGQMNRVALAPFSEEYSAPSAAEFRRRLTQVPDAEAALGDALIMSRMVRDVVAQMQVAARDLREELGQYSVN